jgi:hypothetical protein
MTRLGMVEDDDYLPEFGTLMIRDGGQPAERSAGAALLDEYATDAQPCGTIARAGNGWLEGAAGDGHHTVRLEYHDRPADEDHHDWDDVVETPYRSATGAVGLTYVTGGPAGPDLALGGPGGYRVRVTRRSGEDGDHWLLRFWPDSEPLAPPRWFARRDPAVWPADPGWRGLLGGETDTMVSIIGQADADGATIEHVDDWGRRHSRPAGWLDQELLPEPPEPLSTGHPDLDDGARRQHRDQTAEVARQRAALDGIAAQLGVPAPRTRRHLLAALVAAGVLVLDERDRYRVVADPPRAQDVLDLPADRVAALNRQQARRFVSLASDIISIAAWTGSPAEATVDGLTDRLLTTRENVRGALEFAVAEQLLDMAGELSLTVRPRRPQRSVVAIPQQAPVTTGADEVPAGAPPRAGVIAGDGAVLVWVDGAPVVRTHLPERRPDRALESAHGLVLLSFNAQASLVRPDGSVQPLGADLSPSGVLDRGGHRLGVVEEHYGRRSRHRLHLIDLADGSRQTMPWDESEDLALLGMHDGVAYFQRRYPPLTMRWETRRGAGAARLRDPAARLGQRHRTRGRPRRPRREPSGRHPPPDGPRHDREARTRRDEAVLPPVLPAGRHRLRHPGRDGEPSAPLAPEKLRHQHDHAMGTTGLGGHRASGHPGRREVGAHPPGTRPPPRHPHRPSRDSSGFPSHG